jgi:hypothetical protein
MEPITWGALSGLILFLVAVSGFVFKLSKDQDAKVDALIKSSLEAHTALIEKGVQDKVHELELSLADKDAATAELRADMGTLEVEMRHLKQTAVRREDLTELKSDVKTLVARLEDMRILILALKEKS